MMETEAMASDPREASCSTKVMRGSGMAGVNAYLGVAGQDDISGRWRHLRCRRPWGRAETGSSGECVLVCL